MIVMTDRIQSWNFTASFHYTHEPRRVAMQITLSSRYDYDELAVPISRAIGVFTRITNAGAEVDLHVVKVFRGGRPVSEQEAVETAHSEAARIGHDVTRLRAKVSTNSIHLAAPHRIDVVTGEFVAAPSLEPDIGRLPGPRSE
jgi:hypothetical protein